MKGFVPFHGSYSNFPHSLEWTYIPWKDIQTGYDTFSWDALETFLQETAARGHQAAFRIYADYPNTPYAVPGFLSDVPRHSYTDYSNGVDATSYSPNYDDPRMVRAMVNTIKALGRRYDSDPRIGFVTVGFLGFWGEWHTYRLSCNCDPWMPAAGTLRKVLNAFDEAFDRTKLLLRYPDVGWRKQNVGFHDDAFAEETIGPLSWSFVARLKRAHATKQWQKQPVGGELFPAVQPCAFSSPSCTPPGQNFNDSVETTHASWVIDHYAFVPGYRDFDRVRAVESARRLGYDLFVSSVRMHGTTTQKKLRSDIKLRNEGVAPFYYDWDVRLGVTDAVGRLVATYSTRWQLTKAVKKGDDVTFSHKQADHGLAAGTYTLLLRAVNPLPNGRPLVFANAAWGQDLPDWLTLGSFRVDPR